MTSIDVLLTARNSATLPISLSGIGGQNLTCFRLIVADTRPKTNDEQPGFNSMLRIIQARCGTVDWQKIEPDASQAEQLDNMLRRATADLVLFIDDDVWLAPWTLEALSTTLIEDKSGFVGSFPVDLAEPMQSHPIQNPIDYWNSAVAAEGITPGDPDWVRRSMLTDSDLYKAGQQVIPGELRKYKVAWVDKVCLYDRRKLVEVGGFQFWHRLPKTHTGAQLIPQVLLMRRWGGSAILPSGSFFIGHGSSQTKPSQEVQDLLSRAINSSIEERPEELVAESG